jgi:hypothetical protein
MYLIVIILKLLSLFVKLLKYFRYFCYLSIYFTFFFKLNLHHYPFNFIFKIPNTYFFFWKKKIFRIYFYNQVYDFSNFFALEGLEIITLFLILFKRFLLYLVGHFTYHSIYF